MEFPQFSWKSSSKSETTTDNIASASALDLGCVLRRAKKLELSWLTEWIFVIRQVDFETLLNIHD